MKKSINIRLSNAQIFTASVMIIALASITYQLSLIRKNKNKLGYKEAYFIYPED